jgi:hypothetical protein
MQMVAIVLVLHVLAAFTAVALLVVPGIILEIGAHTRDVRLIRKLFAIGSFHGRVGGPLSLLTVILGFILAAVAGVRFDAGWMIAAYVAYAIVLALGLGFHQRWENKTLALALASPDDAPSPELAAAIDGPLNRPLLWISALLWAFLVFDMVAKPF